MASRSPFIQALNDERSPQNKGPPQEKNSGSKLERVMKLMIKSFQLAAIVMLLTCVFSGEIFAQTMYPSRRTITDSTLLLLIPAFKQCRVSSLS